MMCPAPTPWMVPITATHLKPKKLPKKKKEKSRAVAQVIEVFPPKAKGRELWPERSHR